MSSSTSTENSKLPLETVSIPKPWLRLFHAAWMSIALGVGLELLLLLVLGLAGKETGLNEFIAKVVQKVSWSVFVCVGLAIGTTVAKSIRGITMGVLGLLSAPLAFTVAKAAHKSAVQALGLSESVQKLTPFFLASMKGIEFGLLGILVGYWACKARKPFQSHLLIGVVIGIIFSSIMVYNSYTDAITPMLIGIAINEMIYPVGCAMVLYSADRVGAQLQSAARSENRLNSIAST